MNILGKIKPNREKAALSIAKILDLLAKMGSLFL